jgi:predicted HTH transcriptional regulator
VIPKPLDAIELADLQYLIDNQVRESKFIEYKSALPGSADSELVPFLATVSSFANTGGGDLLLGVEARAGLPTRPSGLEIHDLDGTILRLEQVMRAGLEPRLPGVDVKPVQVGDERHVLVVRAPKSWVSPHRVKKNNQFYGRNSAGR